MSGQKAVSIWKAAALPVITDPDRLSLRELNIAAIMLTALKVELFGIAVQDEDGALSVVARDHSTLLAHINWRHRTAEVSAVRDHLHERQA